MDILKIAGIGLISLIMIIIIKQYRPEFALYISIIAGVIILYMVWDKLEGIVNLLKTISDKSGSCILPTTYVLKKGRIPEKYSLLWYAFSLIILFVSLFPNLFTFISKKLGFEVMSNFIIAIIIGSLLLLTMALTIMIAGQKKKTTMLIQEISLLKEKIDNESR